MHVITSAGHPPLTSVNTRWTQPFWSLPTLALSPAKAAALLNNLFILLVSPEHTRRWLVGCWQWLSLLSAPSLHPAKVLGVF